MPKVAKALSALEVKRISNPGFNAVGTVPGLGLLVSPGGTKSWVYRTTYGNKRKLIGLGGFPGVSLAQAIEKSRNIKQEIEKGVDPIYAKKLIKSQAISNLAKAKTFAQCADLYLARIKFKNIKHGKQWRTTLERYAYPFIGNVLISDIGIANIKAVLDPIWTTKTETASRVQGRIKKIIDYAIVSGYRDTANPAVWSGFLDTQYQSPKKIKEVEHMDSIHYSKVFDFIQELKKCDGFSARALEFLIHTAVRSDSVRSATWSQINFDEKIWTVPKAYTKTKRRDHVVPLSNRAIEILNNLERFNETDLIFPSPTLKKLSDSAISKLMRQMREDNQFEGAGVPHGFRATFSTWRLEKTNYSKELGEISLMHEVGDSVYQSYQRGDGREKRQIIMNDWSEFISNPYVLNS